MSRRGANKGTDADLFTLACLFFYVQGSHFITGVKRKCSFRGLFRHILLFNS